jgi:hypothetical protein
MRLVHICEGGGNAMCVVTSLLLLGRRCGKFVEGGVKYIAL